MKDTRKSGGAKRAAADPLPLVLGLRHEESLMEGGFIPGLGERAAAVGVVAGFGAPFGRSTAALNLKKGEEQKIERRPIQIIKVKILVVSDVLAS